MTQYTASSLALGFVVGEMIGEGEVLIPFVGTGKGIHTFCTGARVHRDSVILILVTYRTLVLNLPRIKKSSKNKCNIK